LTLVTRRRIGPISQRGDRYLGAVRIRATIRIRDRTHTRPYVSRPYPYGIRICAGASINPKPDLQIQSSVDLLAVIDCSVIKLINFLFTTSIDHPKPPISFKSIICGSSTAIDRSGD
jgi:hypothetical protein